MEENKAAVTQVGLSSPWSIYYKQLEEFFLKDPDIDMAFNEKDYIITMRVASPMKAEALQQLLPAEKTFGNVTVKLNIVPANLGSDILDLFARALDGNPIVTDICTVEAMGMKSAFIVFEREVVQYFNDDLTDANGVCSTLYQELAKEIFGENLGVFYSTDVQDKCNCKCHRVADV